MEVAASLTVCSLTQGVKNLNRSEGHTKQRFSRMEQLAAMLRQQMDQQRIMVETLQRLATNQAPQPAPQLAPQTPPLPSKAERKKTLEAKIDDNGNDDNQNAAKEEVLIRPKAEPQVTPQVTRKPKVTRKPRSLKRTLSYEQAFKAGKRQQKTAKERMLRKMLNARLAPLEQQLMEGHFHDETDRFKLDEFYETVSPIVYSVTGPPDECSDEELPGKCMVMAKDIMKKRRQYLKHKGKTKGKNSKKRVADKISQQQPPNKRQRQRRKAIIIPKDSADNITAADVDSYFEESPNKSYNCSNCEKSISKLTNCYPEKSRKSPKTSELFCHKCFVNTNKILDAVDLTASEDKKTKATALKSNKKSGAKSKVPKSNKKSGAKSKVPKSNSKSGAKSKVPKSNKKQSKYKLFDYVLAQFPGYGKKWFKAEIFGKYRGKYNLYFLEDDSTLKHVAEDDLKDTGTKAWTKLKRTDYLNKPFKREGGQEGQWHAVEVGTKYRANKYGCRMVGKPSSEKLVWISVCKVQQMIRKHRSS